MSQALAGSGGQELTRRVPARLISGALTGILLVGCGESTINSISSADSGQRLVEEWLTCIECDTGQLDSVVSSASRDPRLVETLGQALLGPQPSVAALESQLKAAYVDLASEPAGGAFAESFPSEDEFVVHYRSAMLAVRRVRAAIAVARVGGPSAAGFLDSAAAGFVRAGADSIPSGMRRKLARVRARLVTE